MSEEGNLFSGVLTQKRNKVKTKAPEVEEDADNSNLFAGILKKNTSTAHPRTSSLTDQLPEKRNLFSKKRNDTGTSQKQEPVAAPIVQEESKEFSLYDTPLPDQTKINRRSSKKMKRARNTNNNVDNSKSPGIQANDSREYGDNENLFAPQAAQGRTSAIVSSKKQNNMSTDFMSKVNSNNTLREKAVSRQLNNKKDFERGSVSSAIGVFQGTINEQLSGRGSKLQPVIKKQNNVDGMSDLDSNQGRGSVRDMIMHFNSNIATKDKKLDDNNNVRPSYIDNQSDRKSLGDAFLTSVNRKNNHQDGCGGTVMRNQSQGFRLRSENGDDRLSMGDKFIHSINKKQDGTWEAADDQSNQSNPKKGNIFNKVRAMQASQKFSVRSEGGDQALKSKNFNVKNEQEQTTAAALENENIDYKDQPVKQASNQNSKGENIKNHSSSKKSGTGINQSTESPSPLKIVGGNFDNEENDEKVEGARQDVNDTGILEDIDAIQSPYSPDPVKEGERSQFIVFADEAEKHHRTDRVESSKPFDLRSQLKELKVDAIDQRKHKSISRQNSRDPSEGGRRRVLKIKKLGTAASREASQSKQQMTDRSKLTGDIIVYQDMAPKPKIEKRDTSQEQAVKMAAVAEKRMNRPKSKQQVLHDIIGNSVAAQEREHSQNEREFKLQMEKPAARKLSHKFPANQSNSKLAPAVSQQPARMSHVQQFGNKAQLLEEEQPYAQDRNKLTTVRVNPKQHGNTSIVSALKEESIDQTIRVNNQSNLFADTSYAAINVTKRSSQLDNNSLGRDQPTAKHNRSLTSAVGASSKNRNQEFLEYVIGADTLMPKRVRSKKSDLPYADKSQGSRKDISLDAADIMNLQKQIGTDGETSSRGRPKKSRGASSNNDRSSQQMGLDLSSKLIRNSEDGLQEPENDIDNGADLVYIDDREADQLRATAGEEQPDLVAEKKDLFEDDEDMNEVERRIAEQERMLSEFVDNNAQEVDYDNSPQGNEDDIMPYYNQEVDAEVVAAEIARKEDAKMYKQSQKALARYLDSSKDESSFMDNGLKAAKNFDKSGSQDQRNNNNNDQLTNIRHELELEELERVEQNKLEQAIQQAYDNERAAGFGDQTIPSQASMNQGKKSSNASRREGGESGRSQPDFNDVSNIQRQQAPDSTVDISAMQHNIDYIDQATSDQKPQHRIQPRPVTVTDKRQSGASTLNGSRRVSGMPDISDVTDPHALQRNYLERSGNGATDHSTSMLQDKNQREQQLKYELEILELELELQMNEAEISDEEQEADLQNSQRHSEMEEKGFKPNHSNNSSMLRQDINNLSYDHRTQSAAVKQEPFMVGSLQNTSTFEDGELQQVNKHKTTSQLKPNDNQNLLSLNSRRIRSQQLDQGEGEQENAPIWQPREEKPLISINVEDQEVLCSNCYETIPMNIVDQHSTTCFKDEPSYRQSQHANNSGYAANVTVDEESEFRAKSDELNERVFKLIQTFLRKLDSQVFLDQIYTTQGNDDKSNNSGQGHSQSRIDEDKHSKNIKDGSPHKLIEAAQKNNKSATALAEERSLIHEVVQHAHLALQGELHDIQSAAEHLECLEEEHDLNSKFDFNNHMVFNRIVQVVNTKLEVVQDWEKKVNPDIVVPYTSKQLREMNQNGHNYGFHELSMANVRKLPLEGNKSQSQTPKNGGQYNTQNRKNKDEQQLHEYIQASKAQAMQQRKKKGNIFTQKRAAGQDQVGVENWVLSDMGSDNQSIGGDSQSSFGTAHIPRFNAAAHFRKNQQPQPHQQH